MIIQGTVNKVTKYPIAQDISDNKFYTFFYRPSLWEASREYLLGDLVIPTTANGLFYQCTNPGVSGLVAPSFSTLVNTITPDDNIKWKALPYKFMLNRSDVISASSWKSTGITITSESVSTHITRCKISISDTALESFILTNTISITRTNGDIETFDRSILVPITTL